MSGSSPSRSESRTPPDLAQLLEIVENLRQPNESLQESVHTLQQSQINKEWEKEEETLILNLYQKRFGVTKSHKFSNHHLCHPLMAKVILKNT